MDTLVAALPYLVIVGAVVALVLAYRHGRLHGVAQTLQASAPVVEADLAKAGSKLDTAFKAHWPGWKNAVGQEIEAGIAAIRKEVASIHFHNAGTNSADVNVLKSTPIYAALSVTTPKETDAMMPLSGDLLFQLLVVLATGQHNAALETTLGGQYNSYKNAYGPSGMWYQPELIMEAGRASGAPQLMPPPFTWATYQQRGYGSVVNGKWQWSPNVLGPFAAYYKP